VVIDAVVIEPDHGALSVAADTCSLVELNLTDKRSCTVTVRFQPVDAESVERMLVVRTNRGDATVPLFAAADFGSAATPPVDVTTPPTVGPTSDVVTPTIPGTVGPTIPPPPTIAPVTAGPSTTPPVTGPTTSLPDRPDLGECEQRVQDTGVSAAFVPKETMTEGITETVGLSLAITGTPLPPPPDAGTAPTTVVVFESEGCIVTAELSGNDFVIAPSGPQERSFIGRDNVEWSWQVTPTRSGELTLQLDVTPWLAAEGQRFAGATTTHSSIIAVTAKPQPSRSFGYRVNEVVGSPIGATLVGVLVAGVSASGILNALKRKRERHSGGGPGAA
jgi:hypothetical protein